MAKNKRCKGCKVTNFVDVVSIRLKSKSNIADFVTDGFNLSMQTFNIDSDGKVLIKEKFSIGVGEGNIKGKNKKFNIKKSKAKKIMDALDALAKSNPEMSGKKKLYRWVIEITYSDGSKRFARALFSEDVKKKEEALSKIIRSSLKMDKLLLLDSKMKRDRIDKIELDRFVLKKMKIK